MSILSLSAKQYRWGIILILLFTSLLRFYQLGQVPHGMTWDEAAIGYNGFSVLTTRRDEWLTRLPISFWSFGDYKAPLAIYLNGLFTAVFGMNLLAVRLPFAIAGVMTVLGMIYLTNLIWQQAGVKKEPSRGYALLAGGLLMLSPWHHHFSRAGFESGMALMFYVWGSYFFLQALTVKKIARQLIDFLLSILGFIAAVYTYHSAKIAAPLMVLLLVIWHRQQLLKASKQFLLAVAVGLVALVPFVYDAVFGQGLARASTLITSQGNSLLITIKTLMAQFGAHLSASFLVMGETTTLRHGDGQWGVLLPTTFVLVVLGLLMVLKKKAFSNPIFKLAIGLLVVGILPAALGTEVPHSNRALLALPGFILLAVLGVKLMLATNLSAMVKRSFLGSLILFHSLFFMAYLSHYYGSFARESAADWQDGYLAAFEVAVPYERGEAGLEQVDKIIFTSDYGQPYIYALFVRKTNPIEYHGGSLIKYEFKEEVTVGDLQRPNTLVVASNSDELLGENFNADQVIYGSDGSVRFRIYVNK